ncbi:MAG: hypothetical protein AB8B74_01645 [Crocinitomicaceae bacterium]
MKRLSIYFYQKSTLILSIIISVAVFFYMYFIMMESGKCFEIEGHEINSLGLSFGFSYEVVENFFSIRSKEMLTCFRDFNLIWDSIFCLLYGLMYMIWISFLFKAYSTKLKMLNLLPLLQTIFDWLENSQLESISNTVLLDTNISEFTVSLASIFSIAKWIVAGLVFIIVLIGIGIKIKDYFSKNGLN